MAAGAPYRFESAAWRRGITRLAGVDEAGRGPLAGPVVAAAVVLTPGARIAGVDDSKRLPPDERRRLFDVIRERAVGVGVAVVDHVTIDRINILQATLLAVGLATARLPVRPDALLLDGTLHLTDVTVHQRVVIDGDRLCVSIAAASIIAKVFRDRLMVELDGQFPGYDLASNKGYAAPEHRTALELHGPCALHRRTFAGIWDQMVLFSRSELQWIEAD